MNPEHRTMSMNPGRLESMVLYAKRLALDAHKN